MRTANGTAWAAAVSLGISLALCGAGWAAAALTVSVVGVRPGGFIPAEYAYCVPAAQGHVAPGQDLSPEIRWSAGPRGTASYAIILYDPDVPSTFTDANQEGKTIATDLPRVNFYHWVLIDIAADRTRLLAGADSTGPVPNGKPTGLTPYGVRGANSFGPGPHGGYDGPCPPWNDARVHHYHFTVFALDVTHLPLTGNFTAPAVLAVMRGHILGQGELVGVYSTNPAVRQTLGVP